MSRKKFFDKEEAARLINAIKSAEKNTSGEIRIHVEESCDYEPVERAWQVFRKLKMHKTALRNGVLFYLATHDRIFSIIGDEGIHKKVPDGFWEEVRNTMKEHFVENRFVEGLEQGIKMTGEKLKAFFPYQDDDINELPDDISFG